MAFSALLRAPAARRQRVAEGAGIKPDIDRISPLLSRWYPQIINTRS